MKRRLRLLAAALALTTFLPAGLAFAEEAPEVREDKNESILNWLESEDYIFAAERIPTNRWDTPANVHVITAQEIEENHYRTIEEALSHVNGLAVFNLGVQSSAVIMNGDERVLLLIDGRRANNSQTNIFSHQKSDLSMIPSMKMIERIEIVKGGSSALYGTDAVGGVINIITKKGSRNETTIDVNFGSWSRRNYELTNQGAVGKFSWFVTGSLDRSHPYNYKGAEYDILGKVSDYSDNSFSVRMDNRFTDRDSLTFSATHKTHKWFDNHADGLYNNVSLSYNFKEGTSTPGWLRYFNNYKSTWIQNNGHPNMRMQGVEYQNGWEFGRHKIIAGLEWHKNQATDKVNGYASKKISNKAFYLQDTIRLGDKWHVIPGARWDHSDEFGTNWSPKISANYRADDKTKIYASWGRVYRTPTIAEIYVVDRTSGYYGNDYVLRTGGVNKLRPEKGHTETIGIEHNFNDNVGVTVNFFHSKMNNDIWWQRILTPLYRNNRITGYDITHIPTNADRQRRRGVEITFRQKVDDHFSYNVGYSHTKTESVFSGDYAYRPNGYNLGLHYQNRGLRVNLLSFMTSGRNEGADDFEGYVSSKFAVFDLNAVYDVNENFSIYFKANNFTNQNYSLMSKGVGSYHSPGRSFVGGATFRF